MDQKKLIKQTFFWGALMLAGGLLGQPTAFGYLNGSDIFVLVASLLLPTSHAAAAAGISGALCDCLKGYWGLAPFTAIIKVAMVFWAKALLKTAFGKKHPEIAVAPAGLVPVAGYYLYALLWNLLQGKGFSAFGIASATLQKDLIQGIASILLAVFVYDISMGIRSAKEAVKEQEIENS